MQLLDEALGAWRGDAYGELAELEPVRLEALRLEDLRLAAVEERAVALVDAGRATVSGIEQTITQVLGAEGHAELRRLLGLLLTEVGDPA